MDVRYPAQGQKKNCTTQWTAQITKIHPSTGKFSKSIAKFGDMTVNYSYLFFPELL